MKMLHGLLLHSGELCQAMQHAQEKHWRGIASDWQLSISNNILTATSWSGSGRLAREMLHCIPPKMWKLSSKKIIIFLKRKPVFFMGKKNAVVEETRLVCTFYDKPSGHPHHIQRNWAVLHQAWQQPPRISQRRDTQLSPVRHPDCCYHLLAWLKSRKPFNWLRHDSVGIQESPGKGTERM